MPRTRLLAIVSTLLVGFSLAAVTAAPPATAAAGASGPTRVAVSGTLVRVADEPGWHGSSYLLRLADHTLLPVTLDRGTPASTGDRVTGTVAVSAPGAVSGRQTLRLLRAQHHAPRLAISRRTVPAYAATAAGTSHRLFLAAPDLGAFSRDDAGLETLADKVGDYWRDEANGAISSFTGATSVTHYTSAYADAPGDCGLRSGSMFQKLVQEAEQKFPAANFERGSDQLVVFVPSGSCTGGAEGIGYVGSSFASGGVVIAKDGSTAEGTLAHEMGHNFGFQHANLSTSRTSTEYGGIYEVMGFALSGVNQLTALGTANRVGAGVTDAGEITTIDPRQDTATTTRTVTLAPRSADSGVRGLALVDPDTGQTRYLDYRSGGGQDVGAQYTRGTGYYFTFGGEQVRFRPGVVVQSSYAGGRGVTYESASSTVGLVAGDTWTNPSGDLVVTFGSQTSGAAAISVTYTPGDAPAQPADGPTPTIGGGPVWTDTLTAQTGPLDDGVTAAYRWTSDGTTVDGADGSSFTPTAATVGHRVAVSVTYAADGRSSTTRTSAPVTVTAATFAVSGTPTVTGPAVVGATLSGEGATVAATRSALRSTLTWRVDGVAVGTGGSYVLRPADRGKPVTLTQALAADGYTARSVASAPTSAVAAGTLSGATPTITGTAKVGRKLSVVRGTWTAGTAFTYRWYADAKAISGATGTSYTPTSEVRGKRITVRVTGKKTGYTTLARTSAPTAKVAGA